jgi:hypothetical protein
MEERIKDNVADDLTTAIRRIIAEEIDKRDMRKNVSEAESPLVGICSKYHIPFPDDSPEQKSKRDKKANRELRKLEAKIKKLSRPESKPKFRIILKKVLSFFGRG